MIHKIQASIEAAILMLSIHWQPVFGILTSLAGLMYYGSITKMNVVDVKYNGSWKQYFLSFWKYFKRKL